MAAQNVTRTEFLNHIAAMFDGSATEPATYHYRTEVTSRTGAVVSDESYECFTVKANPEGYKHPRTITQTRIGSEGMAFPTDKANVLASLERFFDSLTPDANLRFVIGERRQMAALAHID